MVSKVHRGLNQSNGILFDRDHDVDDIPEQEIQSELESQGVVSVKRFTKKRNDTIEPTNTYLLTFCMPTLPTNILVGLNQMKIDMFIPNPLRCIKYQRFGHGQTTCKGCDTCFKCDEEGRDGKSCQKSQKKSKKCKLKEELTIQKLRKSFICTVYLNHIYHLMRQL